MTSNGGCRFCENGHMGNYVCELLTLGGEIAVREASKLGDGERFRYCPICGAELAKLLLPCPFCGSDDLRVYSIGSVDHVKCEACKLDMIAYGEQRETLGEKWNRRTKTDD